MSQSRRSLRLLSGSRPVKNGRLGTYKYLDMHMAIGSALSTYENRLRPFFTGREPLSSLRERRD